MSADYFDEDLDQVMAELRIAEDVDEDRDEDYGGLSYGNRANHDATRLEDAHVAETVASRALRGRFCWARGLNWMQYAAGCWRETTEARVAEKVRRDLIGQYAREARQGAPSDRLQAVSRLLSAHRIRAVVGLAKGILEVEAAAFDQHPDVLNVGNGVVDLTTGRLRTHDPALLLTKTTSVHYVSSAVSPDWGTALTALPPEVVDYLQVRIGQAATGHSSPDDILPVLQGGGANGKTSIVSAIVKALGGHAVTVPERVLMANPSDHPTELMTLRGARLAVIEETPEARYLSVKRLKDTVGTPTMTARLIGRDNVTWEVTHSLFLITNYMPRVDETDHGTWRRLALIRFPYRFTDADQLPGGAMIRPIIDGLRERLREGRQGQHEAVLAWIVGGAVRWYENDRTMPPPPSIVKADTKSWRSEADLICGYIGDRLRFDPNGHIATTDMYTDFSDWLAQRGHKGWVDQTLTARFGGHGMVEAANVEKRRVSDDGGRSWPIGHYKKSGTRYMAWLGVKFRRPDDLDDR